MEQPKENKSKAENFKELLEEIEKSCGKGSCVCPSCGRCPVCGKKYNEPFWYPQYPGCPFPYYPVYPQPYIITYTYTY